MTKHVVLVALGLLLVLAPNAGARQADLSADMLLARLGDPLKALEPLPAGVKTVLVSSHDRNGGNVDGGSTIGPAAITGAVPPSLVRYDKDGYVLMEFHQPGCLTRLFMGGAVPPGGAQGFGRLQFLFDGDDKPGFDVDAASFFAGKSPAYPRPLVGDYLSASGGNASYVPFCFKRSLIVRTTLIPPDPLGYWQANILLAPRGTAVEPFDPHQDMQVQARRIRRVAAPPPGRPDIAAPGRLSGDGVIRYLRFQVDPFNIETLQRLSLRVTTDGARRPQIDVPLGSLFGDGIETRKINSKAFGMDPDTGRGYLALPIPFRNGASVRVVGRAGAKVSLEGWTRPGVPQRVTLFGEHHSEQPAIGADTRVLDSRGSGWMASLVTDDVDGGPVSSLPPLQRFLEGDERVHIDGARSPSYYGTGHEEINNGGFYYVFGAYTAPFGGAGVLGARPNGDGTQNQYRVFGDDAPRWSRSIAFGLEHGGGDEQPETVELTSFSYRGAADLKRADAVYPGDAVSARSHRLKGSTTPDHLTAYFKGEHDGNGTVSTIVAGGTFYPAPAASDSPEGYSAEGVRFDRPLSLDLRLGRWTGGAVLRGLFDQAPPLVPLAVQVDGHPAGIWLSPTAIPNPSKRWLEDDFSLPDRLTAGKRQIRVTLTPPAGTPGNLFRLETLARR